MPLFSTGSTTLRRRRSWNLTTSLIRLLHMRVTLNKIVNKFSGWSLSKKSHPGQFLWIAKLCWWEPPSMWLLKNPSKGTDNPSRGLFPSVISLHKTLIWLKTIWRSDTRFFPLMQVSIRRYLKTQREWAYRDTSASMMPQSITRLHHHNLHQGGLKENPRNRKAS